MPERNHKNKHIAGKTQLRTLCVDDLLPSYLLYSRHAMLNQEPCNHWLVKLLLTQTYAQQTAKTTSQTTAAHLVCRQLAAVVSVVQATCDVEPGAVHAGHPQAAAAAAAAASAVATAKIAWGRETNGKQQTPTPTKQLYTLCRRLAAIISVVQPARDVEPGAVHPHAAADAAGYKDKSPQEQKAHTT
jgi:hypothetical protein